MIDPVFALGKHATPTAPSATSFPTVIPDPPKFEIAGDAGKTMLWIVFVIMFVSTLVFTFLAMRVPVQKRVFHVVTTFITLFATLSYYAMATGDGVSLGYLLKHVTDQEIPIDIYRELYWARYVDWALTTPLLLLDLSLLAGLNGADISVVIIADLVMVLTGLFATLGQSEETKKWGWYAMGCAAYLVVVYLLAVGGRRTVAAKDAKTAKFFAAIGGFTLLLWTIYPIVWGLGDGARILTVDGEIIAYGILDVLAKPVFGAWLLFTHAKSSTTSIEGFWAHGLNSEGALRLDDEEGA